MAKISLNKLTPIKEIGNKIITIEGQDIIIEQYLPVNEKLALVERVLNMTIDDTGFFNPVRMEVFMSLEMVKTYTNISITDKMMENATKTYDLLVMNNILDQVIDAIPDEEFETVFETIEECAHHAVNYLNSFQGMMKTITENYDATKINVEEIMATLDQPDKVGLVKDILDKIG